MPKINPSMCLKVNRDTFFFPDSNKGVYFRNNLTSFRMEGSTIDQWIEKLIPAFDGTNTLEYLTNSLPDAYKNRVYEIAQILYENGFVRDVSQDLTHQLPDTILNKYASQIEFLDNISDSGGYRFQAYRQEKVLVIGSGPLLISLFISLIKSGLPKFSMIITDSLKTDQRRIKEIIAEARKSEPETEITFLKPDKNSWKESLKPFNSILYGLKDDNLDQLRFIQAICKQEKKNFIPVTILQNVAFAGPLVHPESEGCWESAYRRLHQGLCKENHISNSCSPTADALLANLAVFELFKKITGVLNAKKEERFYLLNLETLEGNWHTFLPHPLVTGHAYAEPIKDPLLLIQKSKNKQQDLHSLFNKLTSKECGVFQLWEEADLIQLPLSQCKIQVVDPLSKGPAQLYPEFVCAGLTHEEARREAGLFGIESYIRGFTDHPILSNQAKPFETWGIGTGETAAEGLCRALQNWLDEEFKKRVDSQVNPAFKLKLSLIEDKRCRFFLQALTTLKNEPEIYLGNELFGFPVVWVGSNGYWYGSSGLNVTMAISKALQLTIMNAQNKETFRSPYGVVVPSINLQNNSSLHFSIPSFEERLQSETFLSALHLLRQNKKQVHIFDLNLEPIFKERTAGIYGILVREEELK